MKNKKEILKWDTIIISIICGGLDALLYVVCMHTNLPVFAYIFALFGIFDIVCAVYSDHTLFRHRYFWEEHYRCIKDKYPTLTYDQIVQFDQLDMIHKNHLFSDWYETEHRDYDYMLYIILEKSAYAGEDKLQQICVNKNEYRKVCDYFNKKSRDNLKKSNENMIAEGQEKILKALQGKTEEEEDEFF